MQRKVKSAVRCGAADATVGFVAAAVTASGYTDGGRGGARLATASANHACYWAGFGEAAGTPEASFLFFWQFPNTPAVYIARYIMNSQEICVDIHVLICNYCRKKQKIFKHFFQKNMN